MTATPFPISVARGDRVRPRHLLLAAALLVEIVTYVLFESDTVRGVLVGAVISTLGLVALLSWVLGASGGARLRASPFTGAGVVLLLIGIYGLGAALVRGNPPYYILADIYHWFIELVLTIVLVTWALKSVSSRTLARWLALAGLALGMIGLVLVLLGMAGMEVGGGHIIRSSGLFRLDMGRGFPITALVFVTAALMAGERWDQRTRIYLWAAFATLLLVLLFTFKRTMWLAYLGAIFLIRAPRKWILAVAIGGLAALVAFVLLVRTYPRLVASMLASVAESLTYSEGYTVEDTLEERLYQYVGLFPYLQRNPMGYGFGAEFATYVPKLKTVARVHYVHNSYLYHLLQIGVPGLLAMLGAWVWYMKRLWSDCARPSEMRWVIRGALGATAVLAVSGLTLVSTHTIFAGSTIALGVVALKRVREPARATG